MTIPRIEPLQARELVQSDQPVYWIDARSDDAYMTATQQIPGSQRLTLTELNERINELPSDGTYISYCT
jgi:hypothetical protein